MDPERTSDLDRLRSCIGQSFASLATNALAVKLRRIRTYYFTNIFVSRFFEARYVYYVHFERR